MKNNEKGKSYCPKCGKQIVADAMFCSSCGYELSKKEDVAIQSDNQTVKSVDMHDGSDKASKQKQNTKSKSIFKRWYFWVIIGLVILVIAGLSVFIISQANNGTLPAPGQNSNIEMPENQGKVLPGGTYTIGEDLPAGRYSLMYTTTLDNKKYWTNDYFYITRSGSEGEQKTLGGTTYDERFGAVPFDEASKGKSFFVNLKSGDKIIVESKYGTWTY